MNYLNKIIALQGQYTTEIAWDSSDRDKAKNSYLEGFEDAKDKAAELAIQADARIEYLTSILQEIADGVFCDLKSVEQYAEQALKGDE